MESGISVQVNKIVTENDIDQGKTPSDSRLSNFKGLIGKFSRNLETIRNNALESSCLITGKSDRIIVK
jgi:hypothetical protein